MNTIFYIFGGVLLTAAFLIWLNPPVTDDGEVYELDKDVDSKIPRVRIHYSYDVGSSVVIVPITRIQEYYDNFTVLSIEPVDKFDDEEYSDDDLGLGI